RLHHRRALELAVALAGSERDPADRLAIAVAHEADEFTLRHALPEAQAIVLGEAAASGRQGRAAAIAVVEAPAAACHRATACVEDLLEIGECRRRERLELHRRNGSASALHEID